MILIQLESRNKKITCLCFWMRHATPCECRLTWWSSGWPRQLESRPCRPRWQPRTCRPCWRDGRRRPKTKKYKDFWNKKIAHKQYQLANSKHWKNNPQKTLLKIIKRTWRRPASVKNFPVQMPSSSGETTSSETALSSNAFGVSVAKVTAPVGMYGRSSNMWRYSEIRAAQWILHMAASAKCSSCNYVKISRWHQEYCQCYTPGCGYMIPGVNFQLCSISFGS